MKGPRSCFGIIKNSSLFSLTRTFGSATNGTVNLQVRLKWSNLVFSPTIAGTEGYTRYAVLSNLALYLSDWTVLDYGID